MSSAIEFQGFSLTTRGPVLSARVEAGTKLAVVGEASSGKSRLLRALLQLERPARGQIAVAGASIMARLQGVSSRATPQTIARRLAGPSGATAIAEALTAARLWDVRLTPMASLTDGVKAVCELLPCLLRPASLIVVDGLFDRLDPWTADGVFSMLDAKLLGGATLAFSTNDLSLAETSDHLLVMRGETVAFFGSVEDLQAETGPAVLEVETDNRPGVRALVDPVVVEAQECDAGLTLRVPNGRETAVKLLLQGYGDVKLVTLRRPRLKDLLLERFRG